MSSQSEKLKVIFFESATATKAGRVIGDGYFSFVPTFSEGDAINITLPQKESKPAVSSNPIGTKTHRVVKVDWVFMIGDRSNDALATLVVSVERMEPVV